jgi:hypothetical protein
LAISQIAASTLSMLARGPSLALWVQGLASTLPARCRWPASGAARGVCSSSRADAAADAAAPPGDGAAADGGGPWVARLASRALIRMEGAESLDFLQARCCIRAYDRASELEARRGARARSGTARPAPAALSRARPPRPPRLWIAARRAARRGW